MNRELFQPTPAAEARLLLLIDAFTQSRGSLDGRTKLAKLDFFLRYPPYFKRAMAIRRPKATVPNGLDDDTIESRMVRYRYGPWDPAYYSLLGSLIGRGLIVPILGSNGMGYRTSEAGAELAQRLANTDAWYQTAEVTNLLVKHFDLTGNSLKKFIYDHFPEVSDARWGEIL